MTLGSGLILLVGGLLVMMSMGMNLRGRDMKILMLIMRQYCCYDPWSWNWTYPKVGGVLFVILMMAVGVNIRGRNMTMTTMTMSTTTTTMMVMMMIVIDNFAVQHASNSTL